MEDMLGALGQVLSGVHLLYLGLGVAIGLTVGLIPGLGGLAGLSMVLPFLFGMDAGPALALMIGLTAVTTTSDTFPSVLIGVPGTAGSQATVLDGFPLAKKGEGARALSAAFAASLTGGIFGAVVLTGAVFVARPVILAIGFGEQLMLILIALTMVGMLTGRSVWKGLASCGLGLLIGAVGIAFTTGTMRMGFDVLYLTDGVPLVVMALGLFAVPEVVDVLRRQARISETGTLGSDWVRGLVDVVRYRWIVLRCAAIGSLLGMLPGLGGTVIDWITYGHVKQSAKDRSRFGHGDIRGVLAPESANNAKEGGALVPTLLFGIPGSGAMAILLGGLLIIGIEPGPTMVTRDRDLVFVIVWSLALANIVGAGTCLVLSQPIARLTTIRYALIAPLILSAVFFASFQATRDWGDLIALFAVSVLGILMKRFGWSRPALLLGFVLSGKVEQVFYHTAQAYGLAVLQRPVVLLLLGLFALSLAVVFRTLRQVEPAANDDRHRRANVAPQLLFAGALALAPLWAVVDTLGRPFSVRVFPLTAAAATLALIALALTNMAFRPGINVHLFDEENAPTAAARTGTFHYLWWLLGVLATAALLGFVPAIALFILVFVRVKADASWPTAGALTAAFVLILGVFSHFLVLRYPQGLLQAYVSLPWPLQ